MTKEKKTPLKSRPGTLESAQRLLMVSLIIYSIGLAVFAIVPLLPEPNPLLFVEVVIAGISLIAVVGLFFRMIDWCNVLSRTAYLLTGTAGFVTFMGFSIGEVAAPIWFRITMSLFIIAGMLAAYGSHIEFGIRND